MAIPGGRRRGFNLVGVLLLVFILVGVGYVYSVLARQAGRSSHWFLHSQIAYNLADTSLKQALFWLDRANNIPKAQGAPVMSASLLAAYKALVGGKIGDELTLISAGDAATVGEALGAQLAVAHEVNPDVKVTFRLAELAPLWNGLLDGIPAHPLERKGVVVIQATGSVQAAIGIHVQRTITVERRYTIVNLIPPLVGRFSLFVHPAGGGQDTNMVLRQYDVATGDARAEGGSPPTLVLRQPVVAPLVARGSNQLDRSGFVSGISDPKFLDKQGWVFLGGTAAAPWRLNLAHGYSEGGESPLLPGDRTRHLFRGNKAEDDAFARRFQDGYRNANLICLALALPDVDNPFRGLYNMHHGTANNYAPIGVETRLHYMFAAGKMNMGPVPATNLKLMGEPDAIAPTLVFGPVYRGFFRRCGIEVTLNPKGICPSFGNQYLVFSRIAEHTPPIQTALRDAFQGDASYNEHGTARVTDDPYMTSLNVLLDSDGSGIYGTDGALYRLPASGAPKSFTSELANLTLPVAGGLPAADLQRFLNGDLNAPKLFVGNLHGGLAAFQKALDKKLAFIVKPEAVAGRILVKKVLNVPGIALVDQTSVLELGAIDKVESGGILITKGPIRLKGDIVRGSTTEPLTLVSLAGGISMDASVKSVDAHLVALGAGGSIVFPPGAITINGGIACQELDLPSLRIGSQPRVINHVLDMDPQGPNNDTALRIYYGGDTRVAVEGGS